MTDEEKAEEYANKKHCKSIKCINFAECVEIAIKERCSAYRESYKDYLDGLAEGRKELEQWKQEWQDAQVKANEEGFARTTLQIKYTKLEKENAKLKAQIEKMKRCENCKHCGLFFDRDEEQFYPCKFFNDCLKYNKWELAE